MKKSVHFVLKHWNEVKFIDRDPHWYTRRVKEAILIRLQHNNIIRDSRMEIPEAWMPTIKIHMNRRAVRQCTAQDTTQPRKKRISSRLKLSHITSIAMFTDHPGNLASVRKIETLPSLRRCHFPS